MKNFWIIGIIVFIIGGAICYFTLTPNNNYKSQKLSSEFTKEMAKEISYAQTTFNLAEENRSSNIKLGLSKLNNTTIEPNETFSLNKILGKRTTENGYKEAKVIVDGQLVPGLGGGVCQIATTLYNAIIKTDAKIIERKHHEFPPAYTKAGQDATIAGDIIDFKFQNTTNYPLYIVANTKKDKACISILSKNKNPNQRTEIETEILSIEEPQANEIVKDSTISIGNSINTKSSKKGYTVEVYKNIYKNEKLINRILITTDTYKPIRGITKIGATKSETEDTIAENKANNSIIDIQTIEEPDNPPAF